MSSSTERTSHRKSRRFNPDRDVAEWHGKYLPYDLVKEFLVACLWSSFWWWGWR